MKLHPFRTALVFILAVGLCACMSKSGTKIDQNKISELKKGVTTTAEVESKFGPPYGKETATDGTLHWWYLYSESNSTKNVITNRLTGGWVSGPTDHASEELHLYFNSKGVLKNFSHGTSKHTDRSL